MILLDTNIVSLLGGRKSTPEVMRWFSVHKEQEFYLCTPVISEVSFGAERSHIKHQQRHHLDKLRHLLEAFEGRILPFTIECAIITGRLRALQESIGRPVAVPDMMIAAIALHNNMTLATRNTKDFDGLDLKLVNPFEAA